MAGDTPMSAVEFVPPERDYEHLKNAAAGCRGCPLYKNATQTVFGEGSGHARVVLVGEQPGDQEDRQGHPFVGPAGKLLRTALDGLETDREQNITGADSGFRAGSVRGRVHQLVVAVPHTAERDDDRRGDPAAARASR